MTSTIRKCYIIVLVLKSRLLNANSRIYISSPCLTRRESSVREMDSRDRPTSWELSSEGAYRIRIRMSTESLKSVKLPHFVVLSVALLFRSIVYILSINITFNIELISLQRFLVWFYNVARITHINKFIKIADIFTYLTIMNYNEDVWSVTCLYIYI